MAIDPRLYEKYSGRTGDPRERLGAALAQTEERKAEVRATKEKTYYERSVEARFKLRLWIAVGVAILGLGAGMAKLLHR